MARIKASNVKISFFFLNPNIFWEDLWAQEFSPSPPYIFPAFPWWQDPSTMSLLEFGADLLQRGFQSHREIGTGPILGWALRPCHYHQRQWRTELETELTLPQSFKGFHWLTLVFNFLLCGWHCQKIWSWIVNFTLKTGVCTRWFLESPFLFSSNPITWCICSSWMLPEV